MNREHYNPNLMYWRKQIMNIITDSYKIAPLEGTTQALTIIKNAESEIARITGKNITLIAYEKKRAGYSSRDER